MSEISRRDFMAVGSVLSVAATTVGLATSASQAADGNDFMAASSGKPGPAGVRQTRGPGVQGVYAICEVTGGGQKVYGIAAEYDVNIDPASLALDTYAASVFPAAKGYFPGMPQ